LHVRLLLRKRTLLDSGWPCLQGAGHNIDREGALLDRQQLETFASVVQHKHFRRAAAALNISPGAVSQRIKALEESVGAMLLMREPTIVPTQAGDAILRYIMAVRLLEYDALQRIKPDRFPPMDFAIAVNADSLATWFELERPHVSEDTRTLLK
ncbi:LysR family transcriptional regulator, partial [Burkholderia multivorans]|uniref:LysR family transcriptional regulator n=1 Tax=Burkholderia multivorans TaxID=87883 RepID=UPI0028709B9B